MGEAPVGVHHAGDDGGIGARRVGDPVGMVERRARAHQGRDGEPVPVGEDLVVEARPHAATPW